MITSLENVSVFGAHLTRRSFLTAGGALVVYLGLKSGDTWGATATGATEALDPSRISSWLEIRADNTVQFRTGKCDFGQSSIYTAYPQIIAEELCVAFESITSLVSGDTDLTPDGGGTFGLLRTNVLNLRKVAAYTREAITELAAQRFGVPRGQLILSEGMVRAGPRGVTYGELVQGQDLKLVIPVRGSAMDFQGLEVDGNPPLKPTSTYSVVGKSFANRITVEKVTAKTLWASDVKLPGMWHGRVVHPPTLGSTLLKAGELDMKSFPQARVVVQKNFVGVVAPNEWEAIQAASQVAAGTQWTPWKGLPGNEHLFEHLRHKADWASLPVNRGTANQGNVTVSPDNAAKRLSATYALPYMKHAPIGPAVALADARADGSVTIHTNTQNPQFLRRNVALMLGIPAGRVVVKTYPGSGHYGRSNGGTAGAEDEAVLLSRAMGRPVRVQWMRPEDLQWSTQSPAFLSDVRITLDPRGRIATYQIDHFGLPMQDDRLIGAVLAGLPTIKPPGTDNEFPVHLATTGMVDRWLYDGVPNVEESGHATWQVGEHESPLHVGLRDHSMRTPIQFQENFPREVAMNEAAALARADAIQYRIDHAKDPRVLSVLARLREESGWDVRPSPSPSAASTGDETVRGRGMSVIFRGNGYWACAAHVAVTPSSGVVKVERITVVVDPGIVVNPMQLKRQVEAGSLMGVSMALHEEVPFDEGAVTAHDWVSYPILKMGEMPDLKVVLVHRPEVGIYGQGSETANALAPSAISSAVFDATGKPIRRLPLRPETVKDMLAA